MARPTQEYLDWLKDNNFSSEDEKLILKTATGMTFLWFLLSCIPTLGMFFLPLLINAWTQRKIVKQKSFEPRPGLIYSLFAVAMYISYILILPWIFAKIAKKAFWGSGLRKLIKKGKVGNGTAAAPAAQPAAAEMAPVQPTKEKKRGHAGIVIVVILVLALLAAVVLLFLPKGATEVHRPSINIGDRNWSEVEPDLIRSGIYYTVTYQDDSTEKPGTILRYTQNIDGTEYAFVVVSSETTVPDFSAATSEDELSQLAAAADLTLTIRYLDGDGNLYDANPGGEFVGIETVEPSSGTKVPRGSAVTVIVRIQLPQPEVTIVGQWHICTLDYSLELAQLTFREDGTFGYYSMGYLPVDAPTDLYLYDQYWSGARGSVDFSGIYTVDNDRLNITYQWYDYDTDQNITSVDTYFWQLSGDALILSWLEGDNQSYLGDTYTVGAFPENTNSSPTT